MGGLERYPMQRSASAPEIRNLWSDQSDMTNLNNLVAYFNSMQKMQGRK